MCPVSWEKKSQDASIMSPLKARDGLVNETGVLYGKVMRGSDKGCVHLDKISSLKYGLIFLYAVSTINMHLQMQSCLFPSS